MESQGKSNQQSIKRKLPPSLTSKNDALMSTKVKWTEQEEEGLIKAVKRYGRGRWKIILQDPDFSQILAQRSNVDLKDKWRNIRDRVPITKEKPIPVEKATEEAAASTPSPSLAAASTSSPSLAAASTPSPSLAAESAKEAETVLEKTEDTDSVLQLVKEHLEKDPRTRHVILSFLNLLDRSK